MSSESCSSKRQRSNEEMNDSKDEAAKARKAVDIEKDYMEIAKIISKQSSDPNTEVGAVIVDQNGTVISTGYNHHPRGCEHFPWTRPEKHDYVVHAEVEAIMNAQSKVNNCKIYTTLSPCNNCAKQIIQAGISEVIYLEVNNKQASNFMTEDNLIAYEGPKTSIIEIESGHNNSTLHVKKKICFPLSRKNFWSKKIQEMSSTSKKHSNFVSEPMGGKSVTDLPGVDKVLGVRLASKGYPKASNVLGKHLVLNQDKGQFQAWMKETSGANSKQSADCHRGLNEWSKEFL